MGSTSKAMRRSWSASLVAMLAAAAASAQTSQPSTPAPAAPAPAPVPGVVNVGPFRELKLAENTWFRFAVQVQAWAQAHQDRRTTAGAGDGTYGYDLFCRRCRFFTTGSVVKNVFFNFLFEAGNVGKADPVTGAKNPPTANVLDAYGQVKFADAFWVSAGSILLPLNRNGMQPTTTYTGLDVSHVAQTPAGQHNTNVLRDLGFQVNGFFLDNHIEYRVGAWQGSRQAANGTVQTAGHNAPRFVASLQYEFWDPEVGYVNGGHYYGTKKVLGLMANADYQVFRKDAPSLLAAAPFVGQDKNAYYGFSGAAFINYPLSGQASKTGGDEIVGLLQFGYYDGGLTQSATGAVTNPGTYPNILKENNYLAEAAYYNNAGHFSIFGKYEKRVVSGDYVQATKAAANQTWIAGGLKYYLAPANMMYLTLQYERAVWDDAASGVQNGTNTVTFAWQTILY